MLGLNGVGPSGAAKKQNISNKKTTITIKNDKDFHKAAQKDPLLKLIYGTEDGAIGWTQLRVNLFYVEDQGAVKPPADEKSAYAIVWAGLKKLGLNVGNDPEKIPEKLITDFQKMAGIDHVRGYHKETMSSNNGVGYVIGWKTVRAIEVALKAESAGKDWKKAIDHIYDDRVSLDSAKHVLPKINRTSGLISLEDVDHRKTVQLALSSLGIISDPAYGVVDMQYLMDAVKYLQSIAHLKTDGACGNDFWPALKTALRAVIEGKDWRKAF